MVYHFGDEDAAAAASIIVEVSISHRVGLLLLLLKKEVVASLATVEGLGGRAVGVSWHWVAFDFAAICQGRG